MEKTVGSLSFTVIDSKSNDSSESLKASAKKPIARTKVPYEKGYSPMDWMKLTRTHPDLAGKKAFFHQSSFPKCISMCYMTRQFCSAGLKGESNRRLITMDEVKKHRTGDSMWTVLKGRVYNIAPYMKFHPGGIDMLMKAVGRDGTLLFNKYHAWVNFEILIEKCLVGVLDDTKTKKQEA